MAVTETTARKAVEAWNLEGGHATTLNCGCVSWVRMAPSLVGRVVRQCQAHRPAWLPQVIRNADR